MAAFCRVNEPWDPSGVTENHLNKAKGYGSHRRIKWDRSCMVWSQNSLRSSLYQMWRPDTGIMVFVLWELGCNTDFVLPPSQLTVSRPANRVPATSILLITSADWNRLKGELLLVIPNFRNGRLFYWAKIVFSKKYLFLLMYLYKWH